jgi:hypothetical protein
MSAVERIISAEPTAEGFTRVIEVTEVKRQAEQVSVKGSDDGVLLYVGEPQGLPFFPNPRGSEVRLSKAEARQIADLLFKAIEV